MSREISLSDVAVSKLLAKDKDVKLRFYYTPYKLTDNSLMFDKEQMTKWWQEGYDFVKNQGHVEEYILSAKTKKSRKVKRT
jgi:hypothetical protein